MTLRALRRCGDVLAPRCRDRVWRRVTPGQDVGRETVVWGGALLAAGSAFKRHLLVAAGFICLGVGVVGVVVPLLPTTPFLLLAAYCFARGSPRWHRWLLGNRVFGRYIDDYLTYKAVRRRTKIAALAVLWVCLGVSAVLLRIWYVAVILGVIGVAVTVHILRLRTLK